MSVRAISHISLNPFLGSEIIQHFLSGCKNKEMDLPAIYLVFPLVYYGASRDGLCSSNQKSSLYEKFFKDPKKRLMLGGLEERYFYYKKLTQKSLIVGHNEMCFRVSYSVSLLETVTFKDEKNSELFDYYKAAYYLGVIFSKAETKHVLSYFGVIDDESILQGRSIV
ncbi:hypothetical protein CIG75_03860 [Tumebacillus algifaecis]|uniref:Uncharacterized protein n=1 Tax=Tumebacillus algifaecis TaxID=1214604 RepID=A0A223CYI0_9BACL|nr:three component ABC system middle component [Tumebacillus algifaecis]ASS74206.1 hypothetical protein CIG75_03860 [Tumebacillus algifaecis]